MENKTFVERAADLLYSKPANNNSLKICEEQAAEIAGMVEEVGKEYLAELKVLLRENSNEGIITIDLRAQSYAVKELLRRLGV